MTNKIIPPMRRRLSGHYSSWSDADLVTAGRVVVEVASNYRYRGSITRDVKAELMRASALCNVPIFPAVDGDTTTILFKRVVVDGWLEHGGRDWIVAELEARSGDRVVAFSNGRRS